MLIKILVFITIMLGIFVLLKIAKIFIPGHIEMKIDFKRYMNNRNRGC